MTHFQEFNSREEALAYMADATDQANKALCPQQESITWGSYWVRFEPAENLIIFGQVFTRDELLAGERDAGADEAELRSTATLYDGNHSQGYLFGRAFSAWEPQGELGDTHRVNMWPITREQFLDAQDAEWDGGRILAAGGVWLAQAYDEYRSHMLSILGG